jgi:prepilin-type N-terminal cleavage/methylation domain-containing protein
MKKEILKSNKKTGFTLVEVIISVALFSIVMTVALAIILSFISDNKKSQAINSVVTNVNFAVDSMVRDIKTGYYYHDFCSPFPFTDLTQTPPYPETDVSCDQNNLTTDELRGIGLISTIGTTAGKQVKYELRKDGDRGEIVKTVCDKTNTNDCSGPNAITSSDINITDLRFYTNVGVSGSVQPSVFLIIKGTSAQKDANGNELTGGAADFTIQTMITQRILNI